MVGVRVKGKFTASAIPALALMLFYGLIFGNNHSAAHAKESKQCMQTNNAATKDIRYARQTFNQAIADKDITAIRNILTENAILITGTDSTIFSSREAQLSIWREDFADDNRLIFIRNTTCIKPSSLYPIAQELGSWTGQQDAKTSDTISGLYTAKWRKVDGDWRIEAETFVTTACTGDLCPKSIPSN